MSNRRQGEIWMANLNPQFGTEIGKVRPVVIVQSNGLNTKHPSTIVCPITTNTIETENLLRLPLTRKESGLGRKSDIVVDQIRTIDNIRLKKRVGSIAPDTLIKLKENIKIVLDIE
jgi:mRNA interferase MazF